MQTRKDQSGNFYVTHEESITVTCPKCSVMFDLPAPKEVYENWQGAFAIEALREHKALSPKCDNPTLNVAA